MIKSCGIFNLDKYRDIIQKTVESYIMSIMKITKKDGML